MKSPDSYLIEMLPAAKRELLSLRDPIRERIQVAIRALADDPHPDDSIAMRGRGTGLHRLRVDSYRVVYRVHTKQMRLLVIRIGHRSEVYRGWEEM